ncbi:hypothetical protein SAMN04488498_104349 [Mesorhizobium albiziae]|uniref:MarR family protein n=1 Tax=Neomesorhizobium albiziae TaxID=335020 RepID=A0A1I3YCG8_9HYPH|nr:winged helix-turn-helix domain-containing protein [Mesorhizobium albiziae]GLS29946.1 hypothetical protein GCM10007937_16540 [Mesorhizobium albiziae]SFK29627.1 hypothetical protein SAMN04488498_104349 [Mesorhizobium albiziae]
MDPNEADSGGVWVTCAELARRRGVSRAAITKRVDQLESDGKIATRRDGKSRMVELVSFDRAVGQTGDAVKEHAAETRKETANNSAAMRDAQTERAQYDARLKALDLAERQGAVLPIKGEHGIEAAAAAIGIVLARDLDGLARYADEIAAVVSREGVAGVRRLLKEISVKVRGEIAAALSQIAAQGQAAESAGPIETVIPDE